MREGFQVPRCVTCRHTPADHLGAGTTFPHPPTRGRCMMADCTCQEFVELTVEERIDALSRAALTPWPPAGGRAGDDSGTGTT